MNLYHVQYDGQSFWIEAQSDSREGAPVTPERIYLQYDPENTGEPFSDAHDVTWCQDRINATDLEYVRGFAWTTERPTVPGWYWWRVNNDDAEIVEVFYGAGERLYLGREQYSPLAEVNGDWAGPIAVPR